MNEAMISILQLTGEGRPIANEDNTVSGHLPLFNLSIGDSAVLSDALLPQQAALSTCRSICLHPFQGKAHSCAWHLFISQKRDALQNAASSLSLSFVKPCKQGSKTCQTSMCCHQCTAYKAADWAFKIRVDACLNGNSCAAGAAAVAAAAVGRSHTAHPACRL